MRCSRIPHALGQGMPETPSRARSETMPAPAMAQDELAARDLRAAHRQGRVKPSLHPHAI